MRLGSGPSCGAPLLAAAVLVVTATFTVAGALPAGQAPPARTIELILDASGSMMGKLSSTRPTPSSWPR